MSKKASCRMGENIAIHGTCTQKEVKDFNPEKSIKR